MPFILVKIILWIIGILVIGGGVILLGKEFLDHPEDADHVLQVLTIVVRAR
jgi:hypothetical protein